MGMRAGIIYKDSNGTSHLTSIQWSTMIDRTLGHFIAQSQAPEADVKDLFKMITRNFGHIGSLEIVRNEDVMEEQDRLYGTIYAHSVMEKFKSQFNNVEDAIDSHLNGGSIGAIFDEAHPERITFYFDNPVTDELEMRNCSIQALGKFYSDVENKPKKRKKFSFRTV